MEDCIFCKIAAGQMAAYKLYEDENFVAFLDIFPRVKGHALLIPKKHYRWVYDVPEFGAYWEGAGIVAAAIQKAVGAHFTSFVTVGEEVPHAHIHILPQQEKGPKGLTFTPAISMQKEELEHMKDAIQKIIASS